MTSFAADIAPLFRPSDVSAMRFRLDLTSHTVMSEHAAAVLAVVTDGSMPCDARWPQERIALLRSWIDEGCPP
jgi:hypothetical protein